MVSGARRSMVFHPAATVLLAVAAAFAAYMLVAFIVPALNVDVGDSWVHVWFFHEYTPVFLMFFASFGVALGILGWRLWLLYGRSTRRSNDA